MSGCGGGKAHKREGQLDERRNSLLHFPPPTISRIAEGPSNLIVTVCIHKYARHFEALQTGANFTQPRGRGPLTPIKPIQLPFKWGGGFAGSPPVL